VAFTKCTPWWGGEKIRLAFLRRLRSFAARAFTPEEITSLAGMRRRVEGLAPKKFVEWDTKRSAGGRYDIEYIVATGMAAACSSRVDYFTMSTGDRIDALVDAGFLAAQDGSHLRNAVEMFMRVEHFLDLQESTHPGNEEKSRAMERQMAMLGEAMSAEWSLEALTASKAVVRACYEKYVGQAI